MLPLWAQYSNFVNFFHSNKIDAYIIPNNDEFNNEYLPPSPLNALHI